MTVQRLGKLWPVLMLLSPLTIAKEYQVEKGDTLSQIAQRVYPDKRVYGREGSLLDILRKNPEVSDPDLILPGEVIRIESAQETAFVADDDVDTNIESERTVLPPGHFTVGFGFGPRCYSQEQTGALNGDTESTFFDFSSTIGLHLNF